MEGGASLGYRMGRVEVGALFSLGMGEWRGVHRLVLGWDEWKGVHHFGPRMGRVDR